MKLNLFLEYVTYILIFARKDSLFINIFRKKSYSTLFHFFRKLTVTVVLEQRIRVVGLVSMLGMYATSLMTWGFKIYNDCPFQV